MSRDTCNTIARCIHDLLQRNSSSTPTPDRRIGEMDLAIRLREAFRELKISACSGIEIQKVLELQAALDKFIRANGSGKEVAYSQLRCVLTKHKKFELVIQELSLTVDLPELN
ncbi:MAG: hypothetical protein HW373_949 [Deltaproteobacteria bacterium]|nr:hypothetical protein [Deltaproteobacteria bacterium]